MKVLSVLFVFLISSEIFAGSGSYMFPVPVREHSVIATKDGYFPDQMSIYEGEKLRIFFTSTMKNPGCFKIKEKKFFLSAKRGDIAEGEMHFKTPGVFQFYCPAENLKGTITVLRKSPIRGPFKQQGRTIQSVREKRQRQWRPREE